MRRVLAVLAAALLIPALVMAANEPEQFGGSVVASISGSAVVQDIDYTTRMFTLKYDNGNTETLTAGPEVRNFNQVNKGDKVNIDYSAQATLLVGGPAGQVSRTETIEVGRAPLGQKPAGEINAITEISAVVEDVDYVNRLVVVKGPQRTLTIKINPLIQNLEKIKKGDEVFLEIDETLAINVTP